MADSNLSRVALVAPFGLRPKATVSGRMLPLAHELREAGIDARLFVPPWDDPERSGAQLEVMGVPVNHAPLSGGGPGLAYRLQQAVRAFAPDLVHIFKPIGYSAAVAQVIHWSRPFGANLPWVVDGDDWEGRGGWADANARSRIARALLYRQERWCYHQGDAVTVASHSLQTLAWSLGAVPARTVLLPNSLTAPLAAPSSGAIAGVVAEHRLTDATVLLYTRFAEFAPEWPAHLIAALLRRRPDAVLLVVGRGLRQEEAAFLKAADGVGVLGAVRYLGWLEPQHLAAHLSAATLALVPFSDTLIARTKSSVKLLELMSLGLPVLASAVGENVHYLDYGRAGVLLPSPLDAEAWAAEAHRLLDDPGRRRAYGNRAASRVRARYLWQHRRDEALEAYSRAAEHRRRGGSA